MHDNREERGERGDGVVWGGVETREERERGGKLGFGCEESGD